MKIEPTLSSDSYSSHTEMVSQTEPRLASNLPPPNQAPPADAPSSVTGSLNRLIGNVDIRHLSPRQMAETSLDLYVAGVLPWEEYAMLAFQPELHPDYDKTIGALTGEKAAPDQPRDFLNIWEDRLKFDEKYNAENPKLVERTRRIVQVFRQIDTPTNLMV